jgi:cytochrome c-type biogenesis protein CcmH
MVWLLFAVLSLGIVALLVVPFLKASGDARRRADYDIVVYRSQLAEIDQEIEEGTLTPEQADAARAEVHRRMLAAEDAETKRPLGRLFGDNRTLRIVTAVAIAVVVPAGAFALYVYLGHPDLPGKPYLWRIHNDPEFATAATADVMALEAQAHPTADGFVRLGRTYFGARQYEQAAAAYRRAISLGANDAVSWSEFGEAVTMTNDGAVVPEAMSAFFTAYSQQPQSERSRFYLGLAEAQIGNIRQAVAIWRDLEKTSDPEARYLPMLREHIKVFAQQGGFDPASVAPAPPDMKAMGTAMNAMGKAMGAGAASAPAMSPDAAPADTGTAGTGAAATPPGQDQNVVAMVDRLAEKMKSNPTDIAGWQRLTHAYVVMGDAAKARAAADQAVKLKPNDVGVLISLAEAQKAAAPNDEAPKDVIATMRKILTLDANNSVALYLVGIAEAKAGHGDKAKAMWTQALKGVSAGDPLAMVLKHRLAGVALEKH